MGRRLIEVVKVLVDQIHQGGYQHRVLEDSIYAESQKRIAAEKDRDHWKQARQDAIEAGELMQAEIETLRRGLADAKRAASDEFAERQVLTVEQQQDAAAWQQQLDSANAEIANLRQQLDAAQAALTRERLDAEEQGHELGRLQAFVNLSRRLLGANIAYADVGRLRSGLAELDAGTEPAPVAEPLDAEGEA